jgi:RND family efflux transporter MFP subunit
MKRNCKTRSRVTAVVLTAALLVGAGCRRDQEPTAAEPAPPVKVQTIVLEPRKLPEPYDVVGTVRPRVSATIAAKLTAVILSIAVQPGDAVKSGAPLARLDDREARAEFERAQSEYNRFQTLLKEQAVTRAEFDAIEARYRVARAALSYTVISAPFDGIVAEKLCEAGDLATPGKALFLLEQPGEFRLEAYIPERFAAAVNVGTEVRVFLEAAGGECDGVVGEVTPITDPATRSFLVKVDLQPAKPLKSGMFGRAQIVVGERTTLFAPKSAVRQRGQLTFVFVVGDDRARMRLVKTGKTIGDQIELLSGVAGGEKVIVEPRDTLLDGRRVSL